MSFTHLHLHDQYSLSDGACKTADVVKRVKELGMDACAQTNHGNMYGAVQFYKECRKQGIKPILGIEAYVSPGSRFDRKFVMATDHERAGNYHLIMLAQNEQGYKNLCKLSTLAFTEGFYYKPRIDKELMAAYGAGLIVTSGCLSGELSRNLLVGNEVRAEEVAAEYARLFPGRFYIEIQPNHIKEQEQVNPALIHLARKLGLPLLATGDCHYVMREHAPSHEVLLCVQSKSVLSDPDRWKFDSDELFIKSPTEMIAAFPDVPEAISNTVEIAKQCNVELKLGKFHLPKAACLDPVDQFKSDAVGGLQKLFYTELVGQGNAVLRSTYHDRLNYEVEVITTMGFCDYFLIVADLIRYARSHDIPVGPGRGSIAGSLIAYVMGITEVDPIKHNLIFERFLNPGRAKSVPDIDMDFCFERRDEVIEYARQKYGEDHVAGIVTFGTLKGKAAIRDVARVLEIPYSEAEKINKAYPAPKHGKEWTLAQAFDMEPKLGMIRDSSPRGAALFEHAFRLEGLTRHASTHAAGIVIAPKPIVEYMPLAVDKEKHVITQFSMFDVESVGLVKFDFLGLKTLTVIRDTLERIKANRGIELDFRTIPLDDPLTYEQVASGDTVGVFQMESGGMRKLISELKPNCFEDLVALNTLFRPGPLDSGATATFLRRKWGLEEVSYAHPLLEPVLQPTFGVAIYQEQIMQMAQVLAGYSLAEADDLRRAMGKKKAEEMEAQKGRFLTGCAENGINADLAVEIFTQMETFAAYGFNRCLVGTTKVATPDGPVSINDLLTVELPCAIQAFDPKTVAVYEDQLLEVIDTGEQDVYEVELSDGVTIECTLDHKFLCADLEKHTLSEILAGGLQIVSTI